MIDDRKMVYLLIDVMLIIVAYDISGSRNPFVEYAVQYSVAAAYATFDKTKKDWLHKCLLQGSV